MLPTKQELKLLARIDRLAALLLTIGAIFIGLAMPIMILIELFTGAGLGALLLVPVSFGLGAVYLLLGTEIYRHGL